MIPGRTVAICGREYRLAIVAMIFPPNAGRVCRRIPSLESIDKSVQSAVSPASTRRDTRGARSRPIWEAPIKKMFGLYFLISSSMTFVYARVR